MSQIYIVCVDDEPEVLEAVERDLATLEEHFPLEIAASAEESREVIERIHEAGNEVGVIFCDHVMPKETGVEFLSWMNDQGNWKATKKALLTGQAGLEATIEAINQARLDYYVSKPWAGKKLVSVAKLLLTDYVVETEKNPMPYLRVLDPVRLSEAMYKKGLVSDK